jgi:tetratricopeptide (TPR) repeat protein
MDVVSQVCGRICKRFSKAAHGESSKPTALTFAAVVGLGLMVTASPSRAQTQPKDLWQSYMEAAVAADTAGDFKTEALVLGRAFAFAKQHDPQGQRPVLSQLPLMLAYIELDEKDLWQTIAKEKFRIDVGNLGQGMTDYISTLDSYGWSYYGRWKAHLADSSEKEAFKQTGRLYGAENSFRVEIALRNKLVSDDLDGLGSAEGSLGLVLSKRQRFSESDDAYNKAVQQLRGSQAKLVAMPTLSALFSVGDPGLSMAERTVRETQIDVMLLTASNLVASSQDSITQKRDADFATLTERALALYEEIRDLTKDVSQFWPRHPFFGFLNYNFAWLYRTQFMMTKMHPDRYPDSLAKAKESFERALAILQYSKGPNSPDVHNIASDYMNLLEVADLPDEAKNLGQRYGSNPSH